MLLQELIESTNKCFESSIQVKQNENLESRVIQLRKLNLDEQAWTALYEYRIWQAKQLGMVEVNLEDMVEMMTGSKPSRSSRGRSMKYSWFYSHRTNSDFNTNEHFVDIPNGLGWVTRTIMVELRFPTIVFKKSRFFRCLWSYRFGDPNLLRQAIPYGVSLRMNELRETNIFNTFHAIAPSNAWKKEYQSKPIDPVIVASIYENMPDERKNISYSRYSGRVTHFFVAKW